MLYIGETRRSLRKSFTEHRSAVTSNDAIQPVARHFNNGSLCVSDMKIRALCFISGSNDSRKKLDWIAGLAFILSRDIFVLTCAFFHQPQYQLPEERPRLRLKRRLFLYRFRY